jgi:L-lactate dehydrogenase complex protein LldE
MGGQVSLFVTCVVDQLFPQVGMAMAEVLERLGYTVDFPEARRAAGSRRLIRDIARKPGWSPDTF